MTVKGTLDEIREKLLTITAVIAYRKAFGWPLFQNDEEWQYDSEKDDRVCYLCREFEAARIFRGGQIPILFPDYEVVEWYLIRPRVHITHPEMKGECRCILTLSYPLEMIEQRLHSEKMANIR